MTCTLVAFHAHPDDEALLTAGTMARAAAHGHRVVLVVATDGGAGLAADDFHRHTDGHDATDGPDGRDGRDGLDGLGPVRLAELRESARALGVARVEWLGYADSGSGPQPLPDGPDGSGAPAPGGEQEAYGEHAAYGTGSAGRTGGVRRFARADVDEAAQRLAALLREERADVLLSYDRNGGYGHRDHVRVHEVGAAAAALAGTPRVLEATVPRDLIVRAIRLVGRVYRFPAEFDPTSFERAYSARQDITHRVSVWRYAAAKRAAMRAHASQASGGGSERTLAALLRVPRPLYDVVFGREWYRDPALEPGARVRRDIFEDLP